MSSLFCLTRLTPRNTSIEGCISDILHGLKAVASGHRMTRLPKQTVAVPTRTQREPAAYRRNSRVLPRYRAVARSRRPHRNPCHCRVTNRPRSSPPLVYWGPASHRFRRKVGPLGHKKTFGWASSSATVLRFLGRSVRSTPACSFLGSDSASEHSSLTGRRGYALVSLSIVTQQLSCSSVFSRNCSISDVYRSRLRLFFM